MHTNGVSTLEEKTIWANLIELLISSLSFCGSCKTLSSKQGREDLLEVLELRL